MGEREEMLRLVDICRQRGHHEYQFPPDDEPLVEGDYECATCHVIIHLRHRKDLGDG